MAKSKKTSKRAKRLRSIREDNKDQLVNKEAPTSNMDTEMNDGNQTVPSLKPALGMARKLKKKKKLKLGKGKSRR